MWYSSPRAASLRLYPRSLCTYAPAEPDDEKCHFQGSPGRGKSGILVLLFPGSKKAGGNESADNGQTISHASDQTGPEMCFPGQLVHLDQAKRGFFPFFHHPEAQEVLVLG